MKTCYHKRESTQRLIKRRVDEAQQVSWATQEARKANKPVIRCCHGGTVCNSYGYPAETECVVTVGYPDGTYWQSDICRISANKATLAGAYRACTGFGILFDARYSNVHHQEAREKLLNWIETHCVKETL